MTESLTIRDVARHCSLSPATVSRVLTNQPIVRENTRRRVTDAIEALGYRPNEVARSLATRVTRTISLVLPDITNPFFPGLARGIDDVAASNGYSVTLGNSDGSPDKEWHLVELALDKRADGVVLASTGLPSQRIKALLAAGAQIVLVGRGLPGAELDWVRIDNVTGARAATTHLVSLGHRRIAFLNGPGAIRTAADRHAGYAATLAETGIEQDERLIECGDFSLDGGHAATLRLLDRNSKLTALFAANDQMAIGALAALRERGLQVPHDVAVVGFDDVPVAALVTPPLTTVSVSSYQMGAAAAELLFSRLIDGRREVRQIVITPRLVIRESCGTAPSDAEVRGSSHGSV